MQLIIRKSECRKNMEDIIVKSPKDIMKRSSKNSGVNNGITDVLSSIYFDPHIGVWKVGA